MVVARPVSPIRSYEQEGFPVVGFGGQGRSPEQQSLLDASGAFLHDLSDLLGVSSMAVGWAAMQTGLEVIRLDTLPQDKETRERHEAWIAPLIGSVAIKETIQTPESLGTNEKTLAEGIRRLREGDESLLPLVNTNIATATGENLEKVRYVMDVELEEAPDGRIMQFGQPLAQVHQNTIQYIDWQQPVMDERTAIESLAAFRIEDRNAEGLTDTHWLIDISLIPDLPDKELERLGFFPRSKTGIIRGITRQNGKLVMRSAFFAGVIDPDVEGGERFDIPAVQNMLVEDWGIPEAAKWGINKTLRCQVAIPKSQMPNGPVDVVPLVDNHISRLAGVEVDWGMRGPRGDHIAVIEESKARDAKRPKLWGTIRQGLVDMDDSFARPAAATEALQKMIEKYGTIEVIENDFYATWVFGERTRQDIEKARQDSKKVEALEAAGQHAQATQVRQQVQLAIVQAQKNAKGGGCPTIPQKDSATEAPDDLPESFDSDSADSDEEKSTSSSKDEVLKCVNCPLCKRSGVDAHIKHNEKDGTKTITCSECKQSKTYPK